MPISLNCDGLMRKRYEIKELIRVEKPDILCLQETKRTPKGMNFIVYGYKCIEQFATEKISENRLITLVKEKLKYKIKVIKMEHFMIGIRLEENNKESPGVFNTYRPKQGAESVETLNKVHGLLAERIKVICIGDWNTDRDEMMNELGDTCISIQMNENDSEGSREVRGIENNRVIDCSITFNHELVSYEERMKDW